MANIDLIKRRVILCAGHGGGDPGSVGQGTTEAAEVIDITNRTVDFLRKDGQLEVVHVPNELSFEQSIAWVNARYKDIDDAVAIDIHKNATVGAKGGETWYADDADSKLIAQRIQGGIATVLTNRGVKPDTQNRWGRLGWCRDVNTWAPLVEMGFVSDGGDPVGGEANQRYAEALAKGILSIWNLSPKPVSAPPAPVPTPVTWTYKVFSSADGKQLGVYKEKKNAWVKYQAVNGAARIQDASGNDLTSSFVLEFNPPVDAPEPQHPVTEKDYTGADRARDEETNTIVKAIYKLLKSVWGSLTSLHKKVK